MGFLGRGAEGGLVLIGYQVNTVTVASADTNSDTFNL